MAKLSVWHDGDSEWVVAESAEDAVRVYNDHIGNSDYDDGAPVDAWEALPDEHRLSIRFAGALEARSMGLAPEDADEVNEHGEMLRFIRPCSEWCEPRDVRPLALTVPNAGRSLEEKEAEQP